VPHRFGLEGVSTERLARHAPSRIATGCVDHILHPADIATDQAGLVKT
jgi:hypothetical protein